jgi:peptide/nickel transport system substrate-binding protein
MSTFRYRAWWAVLVLVALVGAACSSSGDNTADDEADSGGSDPTVDEGDPVDGGELVFAVEGESDGYNPVAHRWSISGNLIGSAVYETLALVTDDGGVEPWLAESLEPNDDGTEWTIVARPDITFHDGSPLDAEVIAANIEARTEGLLTSLATAPIETVEVVDEMTVKVTMNSPWMAWDHSLASQSGYIMSMTNVDDPTADPIGTGPFQWNEWTPDVRVVVDRYDGYWREGIPHLDSIDFEIIVDEQSREQSLEAGDVDAIIDQTAPAIAEYRDSDYTLIEESTSDTHVVMLNSAVPPFDDPVAREAIVLATDNQALADDLNEGQTEVAFGPFASEKWRADDTGYPEPDPEQAAALVEQYEDETGEPLAFTLKGGAGQTNADRMSLLSAQWSAVGMQPEQEQVEQAAFIGQTVSGDYQAAMFRNFGWADPDFNFLFWHSSTALGPGEISVNFTQTKNDDLDAALELGRGSDDPDERAQAYDDVQRILNEEYSYVWLFHSLWAIVSEPEVKGWTEAIERGFSRQDSKIFWGDLWIDA